ncbi:hypothetical protein PtA15_10A135 [Puccinia triticina]|uniref:Uncharacterized protein n=1 Tax=Puccinia triticina TaxID=208348 RepID=A0ABY7CR45_9BASI|nr:uncharacterized protein PtA15_8A51 [Puccinia triticina]XP_053024271.1 uncharacterized protein PtA15_10A135 [Puccinia triticina]WAQ87150.1 hypothetical protein PtA15_8A51 [Puccinia triticina]WAQ88716.1 hypothetical protein PtA15_10A135 [Puccinia triticina]
MSFDASTTTPSNRRRLATPDDECLISFKLQFKTHDHLALADLYPVRTNSALTDNLNQTTVSPPSRTLPLFGPARLNLTR